MLRGSLIVAVLLTGAALTPGAALGDYVDPTPSWPQLLPPAPTTDGTQPGPVPGCAVASIACVEGEVRRMTALRDTLGCDHRAVFATTYLIVTETVLQTLRNEPHFFDDPSYLIYEDALFADYYFRAFDTYAAGKPVPEAWRTAFETARVGDANGGQDMLLGINAHVQRDQPFVLAQLGLRTPQGATRKPDHDRFNTILERSYEPIVHAIGARYDPLIQTTNADWSQPIHNVAGLQVVAQWREGVWRNAERLVSSQTSADRGLVAAQIEANAAAWAQSMAGAPQVPGYRQLRDAYCRAHLPKLVAGAGTTRNGARLEVRRSCRRGNLGAVVTGRDIRRVRFFLDGRKVGTRTSPDSHARFTLDTRRMAAGRHRLSAIVQFGDGSALSLRRTLPRCRRRAPRFTG